MDNVHRFSFQGQESDDEIKGEGNSINYKYRMHDPRIGRFFAVDPLAAKYPYNSPYAFCENRVVDAWELEGLEVGGTMASNAHNDYAWNTAIGFDVDLTVIPSVNDFNYFVGYSLYKNLYYSTGLAPQNLITLAPRIYSNGKVVAKLNTVAFSLVGSQTQKDINAFSNLANTVNMFFDVGASNLGIEFHNSIMNTDLNDIAQVKGIYNNYAIANNRAQAMWWGAFGGLMMEVAAPFIGSGAISMPTFRYSSFKLNYSTPQYAFGLKNHVISFADDMDAVHLMSDMNWKMSFQKIINNPNNSINFLLDGIDQTPMSMILNPGRSGINWEMHQLYSSPAFNNTRFFYGNNSYLGSEVFNLKLNF